MAKARTIDDDGDDMLRDGEVLVVPMSMIADSAMVQRKPVAHQIVVADVAPSYLMHRPGFAQLNDADTATKLAAYTKHTSMITDAWRNPPALADTNNNRVPEAEAAALSAARSPRGVSNQEQSYVNAERRLQSAWRNP